MTRFYQALAFIVAGCAVVHQASAFQSTLTRPSFSSLRLWGKVKRGNLGKEVDGTAARRKTKGKSTEASISPALAEWMATQEKRSDAQAATTSTTDDSASTKASTKRNNKPTRIKQSARKAAEDARDERVEAIVKELNELLKDKPSVDAILGLVRQLFDLPTANFKQLSASAQRQDFRLAWVGSDDAVCHVGSGLHKVPLARLQEVFLSFCGRNRVEVQEIIRVLGPFPNVKNTLQGQSAFTRQEDAVVEWRLTWDSMVDGTGNEILAGKDENVRRVDLQVYFASPSVMVAVVPPDDDNVSVRRSDPLQEKGKHVLVFVREDNLMEQLAALRVA